MQNNLSNKSASKQVLDITDSLRDRAEQTGSDLSSKAKDLAKNTADAAGEYYGKASSWLGQNYGKTLGVAGVVAAAGVAWYFISRKNSNTSYSNLIRRT
jgi:hypothetical protein